jgi:hypothetical protein
MDGQAPVEFLFPNSQNHPLFTSMVRTRDRWYLLSGQGSLSAVVHEVGPTGQVTLLGSYPRAYPNQFDKISLVKQAIGNGIGLGVLTYDADGKARWLVMPIDPVSGELLAVQDLGPADLEGRSPDRCGSGQQGWLLEFQPPVAPRFRLSNGSFFGSSAQFRLRMNDGNACVEGISLRANQNEIGLDPKQGNEGSRVRSIPVAVWDSRIDRKFEMACTPFVSSPNPR